MKKIFRTIVVIVASAVFITGCAQSNNSTTGSGQLNNGVAVSAQSGNSASTQQSTLLSDSNTIGLEDESAVKQVLRENPALAMYVDKINSHEWSSLEECFSEDIRSEITQKQIDNKEGITSVEHIELKAVKEMTADDWKYVTGSEPVVSESGEYKNLDKYNDIRLWFLIFDESVDTAHENKYYPQGLNYNLAITGERDGSQYILDLRNENDSLDKIEIWFGVR